MSKNIKSNESDSVIFLDIDGVLNNDDEKNGKGKYIVGEYVQNLSKLVEATSAKIVLTSSWRKGLVDWINRNFPEEDFYATHYKMLLSYFSANNLHIAGVTPINHEIASKDMFSKIKYARPLEINEWLKKNPNVNHFVILDDEDTWDWGNLLGHVVLTSKRSSENSFGSYGIRCWERSEKGFKKEHIAEAASILKLSRNI